MLIFATLPFPSLDPYFEVYIERRFLIDQVDLLIIPFANILSTDLEIEVPNDLCEDQFHLCPCEPIPCCQPRRESQE